MTLFRRRKPLHQRLAEEGGLVDTAAARGPAAQPPGWDGEQRGEPGVHGVPRAKRWDAVTTADVPELRGDEVRFVVLQDGTVLCEEDELDGALAALAEAMGQRISAPFRAEAVRRGPAQWAVAASRIALVRVPGLRGDEAELVSSREGRVLKVDGTPRFGSAPALEHVGDAEGPEYVVRARRLEDDLWEVEASPL
ncbi:MAG TPA: hypothetical protein VGU02_10545 [Gaiellaceae bacterium]|nr:hypothetical protein [Gaiellaceae bacterium]